MRITRIISAAFAAFALTLGLGSVPAHADATDIGGALLGTLDGLSSGLGGVGLSSNPNIACKVEAYGTAITQHVPYVVGEVYGSDQGFGRLTCVSFDTLAYTASVTIRLRYLASGTTTYLNIGSCAPWTQTGRTTNGVLVIPLVQTPICTYATGSPYLNKYHQAYATATTNFGAAGPQPSTPSPSSWFMNP